MKIKAVHVLRYTPASPPYGYIKRVLGDHMGRFLAENDLMEIESFGLGERRRIEAEICVFKPSEIERVIKALEFAKSQARMAIAKGEGFSYAGGDVQAQFLLSEFQEAIDKLKEGGHD